MPIPLEKTKAICFDYGNTLIAYGPKEVTYQYEKLVGALTEIFGHCDANRLKTIRDRQIVAPFNNGYRENDLQHICEELISELYDITPSEEQILALMQVRYESFVDVIALSDDILPLLHELRQRYKLGFLSNYPCGRSIRDSMANVGLSDVFDNTVVSGDVGFAKPHPKPFEILIEGLGLSPDQCMYIGDNWLADIQGAKRMGMGAIHITQHIPYEIHEPTEGDYLPDAAITHIAELYKLFLS